VTEAKGRFVGCGCLDDIQQDSCEMKSIMDSDFLIEGDIGDRRDTPESLEMDQFTAHLDRGWELVARGDYPGAGASVESLQKLEKNSPDVYTLKGAVLWGQGDQETAVEHLKKALELDPDHVDAMIYLAEMLSQEVEYLDEALGYIQNVRELFNGDFPVEVSVLEAEILWNMERHEEFQVVMGKMHENLDVPITVAFRLGWLLFEAEDYVKAGMWLQRVLDVDNDFADAHYYLGLIDEHFDRHESSLVHFQRTRELDLGAQLEPWSSTAEFFEAQTVRVLSVLSDEYDWLKRERVMTVVLDIPALELVLEGADPRMPVYVSTRSSVSPVIMEDEGLKVIVVVYKRNMERMCRGSDDVEDVLMDVIRKELESLAMALSAQVDSID